MEFIDNDVQLQKILLQSLKKALQNISKNIYENLKKNVLKIYHTSESIYYDRTMYFFNSIIVPEIKISNNEVYVDIGMDYTKIKQKINQNNKLNAHMSIDSNSNWNGISISEALLTWLDQGTENSPIYNSPQTNYWYDVMGSRGYLSNLGQINYKKLDEMIELELNKGLSSFGTITKEF